MIHPIVIPSSYDPPAVIPLQVILPGNPRYGRPSSGHMGCFQRHGRGDRAGPAPGHPASGHPKMVVWLWGKTPGTRIVP